MPQTRHRHAMREQPEPTDEAVLAFAVSSREPDRDVDQRDLAWGLAEQERLEIGAALAARGSDPASAPTTPRAPRRPHALASQRPPPRLGPPDCRPALPLSTTQ